MTFVLAFWFGAYVGGIIYHVTLCCAMTEKVDDPSTFALWVAHGIIWPWFIGKMAWEQFLRLFR